MFVDTIYPTKDGQFLAGKTGAKIVSSPIDLGGAPGHRRLLLADRHAARSHPRRGEGSRWAATSAQLININGLPLLSCLAVSGVLVYLGMHVIERKVIFVDLALAQIAALGVMWAILMGYDHENDTLRGHAVLARVHRGRRAGVLDHADAPRARAARGADRHHLCRGERRRAGARRSVRARHRGAQGADRGPRRAGHAGDRRRSSRSPARWSRSVFVVLHRRFMRISTDPAAAEAAGM